MTYISAKENLGKAASKAVEEAKKILQTQGVKIEEELIQADRKTLVAFGSKYYNIMYWSVNKNPPKDGEYIGSMKYLDLYIAKRTRHNTKFIRNQKTPVLYLIPKAIKKKEEC